MADCRRMFCGRGSSGCPASCPDEAFLLALCIRRGREFLMVRHDGEAGLSPVREPTAAPPAVSFGRNVL